jgi:hypothetical protein
MAVALSWVWSVAAGMLSTILLLTGWGALAALVVGIVGAARRRCPWYTPLLYVGVALGSSILFHGVFWISDRVIQPDAVSTALFWSAVALTALGAIPAAPGLLREIWLLTNGAEGRRLGKPAWHRRIRARGIISRTAREHSDPDKRLYPRLSQRDWDQAFAAFRGAVPTLMPATTEDALAGRLEWAERIVTAYGKALEARRGVVGRESSLPADKDTIRNAVVVLIRNCRSLDPDYAKALRVGFVELESFLPDEEWAIVRAHDRLLADAVERYQAATDKEGMDILALTGDERVATIMKGIVERQKTALRFVELHGLAQMPDASRAEPVSGGPASNVSCWHCKTPLEVTSLTRGQMVRCPSCSTRQQLPL